MTTKRRIGFPLIGGAHQAYHVVPVAAELARREGVEVDVLAGDVDVRQIARGILDSLGAQGVAVTMLRRSRVADGLGRLLGKKGLAKEPMLWASRKALDAFDVLVTPEVTSARLRDLGVRRPKLVCIPHGAGDRAVSFEPRFRRFDRVLVAGEKTAARMREAGVAAERIAVVGYVKAAYVERVASGRAALFGNGRPVLLYNPHFLSRLSSLGAAEGIVRALTGETDLNLVVAPHVRAFENADAATLARWAALAVPGRVIVDTGSARMIDMSYTAAADLYLGDVSSQVYEYLLLGRRPCVFVDAHGADWRGNPDYAFWTLGEVTTPEGVVAAVGRATARHGEFVAAQEAAVAATFSVRDRVLERAADAVLETLR